MTRLTGLSGNNIAALREVFASAVESGELELTATTATWPNRNPLEVERMIVSALNSPTLPRRGHPRASLHAVRRKAGRLADELAATLPTASDRIRTIREEVAS